MVQRGLGHKWVVMLDRWGILAFVQTDWVAIGGLGRWWAVMPDHRAILASV